MSEDWRLNGQERFLFKVKLTKVKLHFPEPDIVDHEHCDFCWGKFSDKDDDLHVGYVTDDHEHIVCEECFNDFKERFEWIVE